MDYIYADEEFHAFVDAIDNIVQARKSICLSN